MHVVHNLVASVVLVNIDATSILKPSISPFQAVRGCQLAVVHDGIQSFKLCAVPCTLPISLAILHQAVLTQCLLSKLVGAEVDPWNPVPAMRLFYWLSKQNSKRKSPFGLSQRQKLHELGDVNLLLELTSLLADFLAPSKR